MILLASYPRSGNTWVRYCIEKLTGLATKGYTSPLDKPILNKKADIICTKRHAISEEKLENYSKVILILRNPHECLFRHGGKAKVLKELTRKHIHHSDGYLYLIDQFREIEKPKLILYYEDLITNHEPSYSELASFLGQDIGDLYTNVDHYRQDCLTKTKYPSVTGGNKLKFHSFKLDQNQISIINSQIEKYPELSRYVDN